MASPSDFTQRVWYGKDKKETNKTNHTKLYNGEIWQTILQSGDQVQRQWHFHDLLPSSLQP